MKITGDFQAFQGDVQIFSIEAIPTWAKKINKQFVAASGRSGSFHALFGDYDMYETEGGVCVDVKEDCILNHSLQQHLAGKTMDKPIELPKKDHRHTVIPKGKYFLGIQRRVNPFKAVWEKVKD
jgi:hypothetical protein